MSLIALRTEPVTNPLPSVGVDKDLLAGTSSKQPRRAAFSKRKSEYLRYLESAHWKTLRRKAFERDGKRCCRCGRRAPLCGHHLRYSKDLRSLTVDDIQTLCWPCHGELHSTKKITRRRKRALRRLLELPDALIASVRWDYLLVCEAPRQGVNRPVRINSAWSKLTWLVTHQPTNLWAINTLRLKLGMNLLDTNTGLGIEPEKHWVNRGRSSN